MPVALESLTNYMQAKYVSNDIFLILGGNKSHPLFLFELIVRFIVHIQ